MFGFSFIKGLLSSDKIISGGIAALDKMVFTDEEKSDMKMQFIKATMPMNRARRFLAMMVGSVWALHACIGTALLLSESAMFATFLSYMTINITAPFLVIVGFYFYNEKLAIPALTQKK